LKLNTFFDTRTRRTFVFKFVSLKFQAVLLEIPTIISSHVFNTWQFFYNKMFFITVDGFRLFYQKRQFLSFLMSKD
jgi:hypothetical protein